MRCKYPLELNSSKPWSISSNLLRKKKTKCTVQRKKKPHKPKTLQQKVRLFKPEFTECFLLPLFPGFIRHLDVLVVLGGAGEATQVSASCSFIQCISKAGVGVCQLTRETVNKYRRKLWSFHYILVL